MVNRLAPALLGSCQPVTRPVVDWISPMSRDVNFSLANLLSDFGAVRRSEQKAPEAASGQSPEDADARKASFGQFVSGEAHKAHAAMPARSRAAEAPRADRAVAARAKAADRPAAAEKPAREKDEPARADGEQETTEVTTREPAGCAGKADAKPARTDGGGDEAGAAEKTPETAALTGGEATPAATETAPQVAGLLDLVVDPALVEGAPAAETPGAELLAAAVPGGVPATDATRTTEAGAEGQKVGGAVTGILPAEASDVAKAVVAAKAAAKADEAGEAETMETEAGAAATTDAGDLLTGKKADEATAKGAADATKKTVDGEAGGILNGGKGERAEAVATKSAAPNLHPTRAAHFADMLEGFTGQSAVHRPADILAGLDRSVAATALNRGAEVSRPTPLQMLPIEIGMQAVRGVTNFQIRLDPAELGRVDVKLQIRENGEVNASLVVDRVETLQMLRRDASTLQNAFEQAGLKQSPDGLTFSLRGEGQQGQQQEQRRQGGGSVDNLDDLALQAQIGDAAMRRVLIPNSSIDRMV